MLCHCQEVELHILVLLWQFLPVCLHCLCNRHIWNIIACDVLLLESAMKQECCIAGGNWLLLGAVLGQHVLATLTGITDGVLTGSAAT